MSELTQVAICVSTLQRPQGLRALLDSLTRLRLPEATRVAVVVCDNDGEGSGRRVVEEFVGALAGEIRYVIEPRRGIPFARNTAVAEASGADWIAFVDDDETVDEEWLRRLVHTALEHNADVVTGPVLPVFEAEPPDWVLRGGFFERPRFSTGTPIPYARTSNALVAGRLLTGGRPFSESLGNNGGDDTHFFQRVRLSGGLVVWDDDAIVKETVPISRVNVKWLVRRAYRRGNTLSLCLRDLEDSWPRRLKRVGASTWHMTAGIALVVTGIVRGRVPMVHGLQKVAFGLGLFTGLTGSVYEEYVVVHGR
jgi:glycosyltransferase involved in cell wall biosynthesis